MKKPSNAEVERAIRFIMKRIALHQRKLALEVGGYLFENFYGGNVRYVKQFCDKDPSIEEIAADDRVVHSAHKLRACLHFYILEKVFRRRGGRVPNLSVWQWHEMWELEGDPESLVAIASWTKKYQIPQSMLQMVTRLLGPYLEAGGKMEDLILSDEEQEVDTPYDRFKRMAGIARSKLQKGPKLSRRALKEALALLDEMEHNV